jgi:hypothetical protein
LIPSSDNSTSESEEDAEFSVPESPNEKTLREVMARSPWTTSPSPSSGTHVEHEDHHRGRNNSLVEKDIDKHNRRDDNRNRSRSKSKEKVKIFIPKDQPHSRKFKTDDLDDFDPRFYQLPESAKYKKDTVTTRNLQQQIYSLTKVQELHQKQIQQLERTVHEIQMTSKTAEKKPSTDSNNTNVEEKKPSSDKNATSTSNPTIVLNAPNPVVAAVKTTEKSNENVVENAQGDKKVELAVNTEQKQATVVEVLPKDTEKSAPTALVTTTSATKESVKATVADSEGKATVAASNVTVAAPVTVKEVVIPTPECTRTGRLRFASWNIEWFDQIIEEHSDGTFTIIGQSRNEGITDGNELSKRIAGIIKELDPDVMGIQEGPANIDKLKFWIKTYLNDSYDCFGGIDGDHQRIYIMAKKNGPLTDVKLHVPSNDFLAKKWEFDVSGQFKLESYGFTRRPVVVQAEINLPNNPKQPMFFIALHLKSKHVGEGEELWRSLEPEKQQEYIRKAVKTRRRIASECTRVRKCIDSVIFTRHKDAMVVVAGDLNDGPGMDFFEEYYLLFDSVEILMGSPFYAKKLLKALLNEKSNLPEDQMYSVVFDDFVDRVSEKKCLLDHIFISPNLDDQVTSCGIAHGLFAKYSKAPQGLGKRQDRVSDHTPVYGDFFAVPPSNAGK